MLLFLQAVRILQTERNSEGTNVIASLLLDGICRAHDRASRQLPLADCFVISLAEREKATVVTSDHHEFDCIIEKGFCPAQ